MRNIITLQLDELILRLANIGIALIYDTKAVTTILEATYNPAYGARPVRRYIQDSIEDKIAENILNHKNKKHVSLSAAKKEITFTWK